MKQYRWIAWVAVMAVFTLPLTLQGRNLDLPGVVTLDRLSNLYEGAEFDHEMHTEIADDCTWCHHHTVGIPSSDDNCARCHSSAEDVQEDVACVDCHVEDPFSAQSLALKRTNLELYHIDKPGLKAAYHLGCFDCHVEMGGPTGCTDCHERTEAGEAFYRSGRFAPETEPGRSTH